MTANANSFKVICTFDFSKQPDGEANDWLKENGFKLRLGAKKLNPCFKNHRLVLQTCDEVAGLFTKKLYLEKADRIRIYWGVDKYPQGANWEQGTIAVPIAVMVSFGTKKISSGSFFIPNAPYFLGIFLGEKESETKTYMGRYYKKGGRYFCRPCNAPCGKTVITDFDLTFNFHQQFPEAGNLPVTSFDFQMDTKNTSGGACAFIQKVEFLSNSTPEK